MMALDISPSMLSRDFEPDRLTVSKQVAIDFVQKRPNDRIGLVVFSAEAFTHCPLTPDKRVVQQFIEEVSVGVLEDGTAIGLGLATALNRLKGSTAKSKLVVLLTDGENTVPTVLPEDAAQIAVEMGVKVYTIGIGKEGLVESPVSRFPDGSYAFDIRRSVINTRLLESIAAMTGGRFYRAYSAADLSQIYDEIDQLEKTKVELTSYKRSTDYFQWLVGLAGILLLVAFFLQWFLVRTLTP
jgi:Ca-activated chloride channel family protein